MGFFDRLFSGLGIKQPTIDPQAIADTAVTFVKKRIPPSRSDQWALAAYHGVPALNAAVRITANKFSTVDWHAIDPETRKKADIDEQPPIIRLVRDPCPAFSGVIYHKLQQIFRDVSGDSFAVQLKSENPEKRPMELYPIPPHRIQKRDDEWIARIAGGELRISEEKLFRVTAHPNVEDPYGRGRGLGHTLSDQLQTLEYMTEYEKGHFFNDSKPDFIIRLPGAGEKQIKQFKEKYKEKFSGPEKSGEPLVAGDTSELQIQELTHTIKENLLPKEREQYRDLIRMTMPIPPELMGKTDDANRATSYVARKIFAENNTEPRARTFQQAFNSEIAVAIDEGEYLLGHASTVPEDREFRLEVMSEAPKGSYTRNDWRKMAGFQPDPEMGEMYLLPSLKQQREEPSGFADGGAEGTQEQPEDDEREIVEMPFRVEGAEDLEVIESKQPPDLDRERTADEIARALKPERIRRQTKDEYQNQVENFAQITATEELPEGVSVSMTAMNPLITEYVEEYGAEQVVQITETQRANIRSIVKQGFEEGKNPKKLIGDLDKQYEEEIIPNRAEVIGRTEMLRASNQGTYAAHKISGVVSKREWISTIDSATRARPSANHIVLHGQTVGIDDPFKFGSLRAMYPGDWGVAGMDCNCRCTTAAVVPERAAPRSKEEYWKRFDSRLADAENAFRDLFVDVLRTIYREDVRPRAEELLREAA